MGAFSKLFGKEKKKTFKAYCELSKQPLEKDATYVISTAELISSKRFWDNKMTEPETMTYTQMHFDNKEAGTNMRGIIFNKYSQQDKAWLIGEDQVNQFEVDREKALASGNAWLESEGKDVPTDTANSLQSLTDELFDEFKEYAIKEAGKKHAMASA